MTLGRLEFHEVDESRWVDLVRLFEGRGGPRHCWCMVWRAQGGERGLDAAGKKAALARRVREQTPIGLLAYESGEPVAWCSIAPRETYRPLGGGQYGEGTRVWSVVCFFAQAGLRGHGITGRLLKAGVARAKADGAEIIEGYPVDPESPSYRFMGFRSTFLAAGFEEVGRVGTRRHMMRLDLRKRRTVTARGRGDSAHR